MPELNKHEIRSSELQEVMSEIPGRFLKWGLFLFFGIIVSILAVSWFVSYPTIITAPVTITTYNSPLPLMARSGGKISILFSPNEGEIVAGQPVALIENQADWNDVIILTTFLNNTPDNTDWVGKIIFTELPSSMSVGEIQDPWIRFESSFRKFREYLEQAYLPAKMQLLKKQIDRQGEYIAELNNQKVLSQQDLDLSVKSFLRDSMLYYNNKYSITLAEFEKSKQALLQKKVAFSSLVSSLKNSESSMIKMEESLLDLRIQSEKEISQYKSDLNEAFQVLKISVGQWKEKYLLQSPVNGKVTYTGFWNVNQVIKSGEILATVIPHDSSKIIVRAAVPVSGLGKVKKGQFVNIKLSGYPYMEYGVIRGCINSISLVPMGDSYIAEIDLLNGMRTSYNLKLDFIREMTGTADIITESSRLIYRLVKPLKIILNR